MPNKDQTGPEGLGPRTGWQEGDCADNDAPSSAEATIGRGRRWWPGFGPLGKGQRRQRRMRRHARRLGRARRFGRKWLSQEQQVENLKGEAAWLQEQLDAVNQRIEEIAG